MSRTYSLLFAFAFCLFSQAAHADTIACDSPDLGLANASAKEEVDAMLKQATACVHETKPGRAVAILTQVIRNDPRNAVAYTMPLGSVTSLIKVTVAQTGPTCI
jgi:hypothetical protein